MGMDELKIKPQVLAEMIRLIEDTTISGKIAKDILPDLLEGKANDMGAKVLGSNRSNACSALNLSFLPSVQAYVEKKGLLMISDEAAISSMVAAVLAANPKELADYRGGKTKLMGFFQG